MVLLALVLVEVSGRDRVEAGVEVADPGERKRGGLIRIVWNLIAALVGTQYHGDARVVASTFDM